MRRVMRILLFVLLIVLSYQKVVAQLFGIPMPVHDPILFAKMVERFNQELKQWKEQLNQFKVQKDFWAQEIERFKKAEEQWKKENELYQKLTAAEQVNNNMWANFTRGVGDEFSWDDLRLKSIEDVVNLMQNEGTAGGAYGGLFTPGAKIENIFPGIRDWSYIKSTDKYKQNSEFREYVDLLIESQKKMLDDLETKINVVAKINKLVPEREKKFLEIQKKLEEYAKEWTVSMPKLWLLHSEVNLEISREMFHLIFLSRVETENQILDMLRDMNSKKSEEKYQEENKEKDKEAVMKLVGGK